MVPCTRLKPALSPHSKVMLEYARVLDVKKAARCLSRVPQCVCPCYFKSFTERAGITCGTNIDT